MDSRGTQPLCHNIALKWYLCFSTHAYTASEFASNESFAQQAVYRYRRGTEAGRYARPKRIYGRLDLVQFVSVNASGRPAKHETLPADRIIAKHHQAAEILTMHPGRALGGPPPSLASRPSGRPHVRFCFLVESHTLIFRALRRVR
jgi:hypothetical protein